MENWKEKLKWIIWKDLKIRQNTFLFTISEIVPPLFFVLLIIVLKHNLSIFHGDPKYSDVTEYFQPQYSPTHKTPMKSLYYAPSNTQTNKIMDSVKATTVKGEVRGFSSESMMVDYLMKQLTETKEPDYINSVGVVFDNVGENALPKNLEYRIRAQAPEATDFVNLLYARTDQFVPQEYGYYFSSYFLPVQEAVDSAFINLHKNFKLNISFQHTPVVPHWDRNIREENFSAIFPLAIINAYIFNLIHFTRQLLEEKSTGMTELLKMMGLKQWMLWLSWYINNMITVIPSIIIITIMFKFMLLTQSDVFIVAIFLFMYCTTLVCYVFCMSTLFNRPMMGTVVILIVWVISLYPAYLLQSNNDPHSFKFLRHIMMIFPNSCLIYGTKTMYRHEYEGNGLTWSKLYKNPSHFVTFHSMGILLFILLLESLLFMFLTWYISQVKPGQYGIGKPWKFLCQKKKNAEMLTDQPVRNFNSHVPVEAATSKLKIAIQIRNLNKIYGETSVVRELSFDVYTNQLTVLLGHYGSGKTTTVNIICGMQEPNSGTVLVDGYSIRTEMDKVRSSLGLCPQYNVHFANLNVIDHLMLFAMLKGMTKIEAKKEALDYLKRFELSQKANVKVFMLSAVMKRRLSVSLAFIGSSKIVILDEPTFGIDLQDRRDIWNILLKIRGKRTILMTTHFMDEASVLGDRIAVIHNGQLICYGTSMFLKKHYGTGYTMKILVLPRWDEETIISAIKNFIPNAAVKQILANTVTVVLPPSDTAALTQLFLEMDNSKEALGIASYGISLTTMDDMLFSLVEDTGKTGYYGLNSDSNMYSGGNDAERNYNSGFTLMKQQFLALLIKRTRYYKHKWRHFLLAICLPLATLLFILITFGEFASNKQVILSLGSYPYPTSYYSYAEENSKLASYYAKTVKEQYGNPVPSDQVSADIVKVGMEDVDAYLHKLVTAAEFNSTNDQLVLNAMYGAYAVHSPAISLNLIMSALLKFALDDEKYYIQVGNHPLAVDPVPQNPIAGLMWAIFIPTGLTLLVGILLMFYVNERSAGVKHLQIMSGAGHCIYWLGNFIFDMSVYICVMFLFVLFILAFGDNVSYSSPIQAFMLIMFLFGLSIFPFAYFFHYRSNAQSSFIILLYVAIFFSVVTPIGFAVWRSMAREQAFARETLQYVFMVFPHYAFSYGLEHLVQHAAIIHYWEKRNALTQCDRVPKPPCCVSSSEECKNFYNFYNGENSLLPCVIFLILDAVLYSAVFLIFDYGLVRKYIDKAKKHAKSEEEELDPDVVKERKKIATNIKYASLALKAK